MDIEHLDERDLIGVWDTYRRRSTWHDVIRRGGNREVAEQTLAALDDVTALDALKANRRLIAMLTDRRWWVMRDAIEAGASWSDVGAALGMSRQGAHVWYHRKIREQETHVPGLHDTDRGRAVLDNAAQRATSEG